MGCLPRGRSPHLLPALPRDPALVAAHAARVGSRKSDDGRGVRHRHGDDAVPEGRAL